MTRIRRRTLLQGLSLGSGAAVLGPLAQRLHAEADGEAPPTRWVFVLEGNGLNPKQIQPIGIERKKDAKSRNSVDKLVDQPLAPHKLPEALGPLEPFKDRLTICQGLSGRICGGGHSNDFGALGCYPHNKGAYGETIDAALREPLCPGRYSPRSRAVLQSGR